MQTTSWTLAPYLHVDNASAAIDWYVRVLGAQVRERHQLENGQIVHSELDLHGNMLCVADLSTGLPQPDRYDQVAITLYAIVPDVDNVFNRAIEAGARVDRPLANQDYGQRNGGFIDPFGHSWFVGSPITAAAK
jgi:PhnB protein